MEPKCPECDGEMVRGNIPNRAVNFQEGEELRLLDGAPRMTKLHRKTKGMPAWICRECKLCVFRYDRDV